jgi:hypothetical protein
MRVKKQLMKNGDLELAQMRQLLPMKIEYWSKSTYEKNTGSSIDTEYARRIAVLEQKITTWKQIWKQKIQRWLGIIQERIQSWHEWIRSSF